MSYTVTYTNRKTKETKTEKMFWEAALNLYFTLTAKGERVTVIDPKGGLVLGR